MATKKAPAKKPASSGNKIGGGGGVKNASTPKGKAPGATKRAGTKKKS